MTKTNKIIELRTLENKRGYHFENLPTAGGYRTHLVKNGYKGVPCDGPAHYKAHQDNCSKCLSGVWGLKAVKVG